MLSVYGQEHSYRWIIIIWKELIWFFMIVLCGHLTWIKTDKFAKGSCNPLGAFRCSFYYMGKEKQGCYLVDKDRSYRLS